MIFNNKEYISNINKVDQYFLKKIKIRHSKNGIEILNKLKVSGGKQTQKYHHSKKYDNNSCSFV